MISSSDDAQASSCVPLETALVESLQHDLRKLISGALPSLTLSSADGIRTMQLALDHGPLLLVTCQSASIPWKQLLGSIKGTEHLSPERLTQVMNDVDAFAVRTYRNLSPFVRPDMAHVCETIFLDAYATPFGPDVIEVVRRLRTIEALLDAIVQVRAGTLIEEACRHASPRALQPPAWFERTASMTRLYSA